jgi:predicted permease
MTSLWPDLRLAVRGLRRSPLFAAVAILSLALGIGANTAIFTLFNAILLEPLPVREPGRLVLFTESPGEGTSTGSPPTGAWRLFSTEVYDFLRRQSLPFESIAAVRSGEAAVSVRMPNRPDQGGQAQRGQAHLVSGNYFAVMGVGAMLGRTLTEADDRSSSPPATVVSHRFWTQRLEANPAAIGTVILVNGTAFTIVGVTPPEFFGERMRRAPDFWMPLAFQPQIELRPSALERTDTYWLNLIARLAPGATRSQAQIAATAALRQFLTNAQAAPLTDERRREIQDSRVDLVDGAAGVSGLRAQYAEPLRVLLAVVGMVLLIACANVGNLLLSRAAARQSEITVRIALGATRARLIRQSVTESLLLAALGAICGVVLARWVVAALLPLVASPSTPMHVGLDLRVLAFTTAVTCATGVLFGLAPALYTGRTDAVDAIKSGGRGATLRRRTARILQAFVVGQLALSLVLVVGANLFARSLLALQRQPLGFEQEHVLLARINPRLAGYTPSNVAALYRKLYDRLNALPGVQATIARYSPLSGSNSSNSGNVAGYTPKPGEDVEFETIQVAPSYPDVLGMRLVDGRAIGLQDGPGTPKVAMVNETFARRFFAGQSAVGHRFGFGGPADAADVEIVGVLQDARFHDVRDAIVGPMVFLPLLQEVSQFALAAEVAARTSADAGIANELRRAIAEIDPNLPVDEAKTLDAQIATTLNSQRLAARLVMLFGALALLLAAVGLYGVITQSVVRRTGEIGVRMALGAQRRDVLWMILRDVLQLVAMGFAIGIPVAIGATRLVSGLVFGLSAAVPASFALAIAILGLVAAATGLLPARRATNVDPVIALRHE